MLRVSPLVSLTVAANALPITLNWGTVGSTGVAGNLRANTKARILRRSGFAFGGTYWSSSQPPLRATLLSLQRHLGGHAQIFDGHT